MRPSGLRRRARDCWRPRRRFSPLPILLIPVLVALSLFAQTRPVQTRKRPAAKAAPTNLKLTAVQVSGSQRYKPEDVVAATGLQMGQTVTDDDFKRVTQNLGETGAFADVAYNYEYSGPEAKLELQVRDADQFVPARFDNFVWLSEPELRAKLHSLTPLFDGDLPLSGNLADQISEDLQAFLTRNNLPGHVNYLKAGVENGPVEAFVFSVADVSVRIRKVEYSGAGEAELPALQAAAQDLEGEEFSRAALENLVEKYLLPVYRARGYLKATISDPQARIPPADAKADPKETQVDVTFGVNPGAQYKLAEIRFSGEKVIPAEKLMELIHLQTGKPADAMRLAKDIAAIVKLYGAHGYMAASIHPAPVLDDAAATVAYHITIQEGEQYHMGELDIRGLDTRTTDRLQLKWKLHSGDAYDSSYAGQFADEAKGQMAGDWDVSIHETPDAKDKTVDVTLRFDRKS